MVMVMYSMKADKELLEQAKSLGVNISQAARNGVQAAVDRQLKIKELLGEA